MDFDVLRFARLKFSNLFFLILIFMIFMICHVEIPNGRTDCRLQSLEIGF